MNLSFEVAEIIREKTEQAVEVLKEKKVDLWLTFVRETRQVKDPAIDLLLGFDLTWPSALLIHRRGERIALAGRYDIANIERLEAYTDVQGYDESIQGVLLETLKRLKPRQIAVKYSESDPAADGLTYGMFRSLSRMIAPTPYCSRLISAEEIIGTLRGRKTESELALIRGAISHTEEAFDLVTSRLQPGMTDLQIVQLLHNYLEERGFLSAWDWEYCPIVTVAPDAEVGHTMAAGHRVEAGNVVRVDFGISRYGFVSDLQRTWYVKEPGEQAIPPEVARAWEAVSAALEAGRAALKPGVQGWEIDAAARRTLVDAGYAEYLHAFGHHIGRTAHDGATILGPKWERYGDAVEKTIEEGNVFAIELGVAVPGRGYVGREEDVVVTDGGAEYISNPQQEIWTI